MADLNRFPNRLILVYKNKIVIHLLSDNIVISWVFQKRYCVAKKMFEMIHLAIKPKSTEDNTNQVTVWHEIEDTLMKYKSSFCN